VDFTKSFSRGWQKVVKFVFYLAKLRKQPFLRKGLTGVIIAL